MGKKTWARSTLVIGGIFPVLAEAPADAQSGANEGSVLTYVRNICPDMRTLNAAGGLTADQQQLFFRCRAVVNSTDATRTAAALPQITSEELLAQDAALRGASQPQTAVIAARLNGMAHFSTQSMATASRRQPVLLARNEALQSEVRSDTPTDFGSAAGPRLQGFGNIAYSGGHRDTTALETGFGMNFVSVVGGADYRIAPTVVAGGALGYGNTRLDFYGQDGSLHSDAYTAALYADLQPDPRASVSLLAAYSRVSYRGARNLNYSLAYVANGNPGTDTVQGTATSRTRANQFELTASAFYNLGVGAWTVGPAAQVSGARLSIDRFSESGAAGLGFAFPDQRSTSLQLAAGFDVSKSVSASWGILSPYARARAVFETRDRQRTVSLFYVNDPFAGQAGRPGATLTTSPTDRTRFTLGAGIAAQLPHGVAVTLDGQALIGMRDVSQQGVMLGVRLTL